MLSPWGRLPFAVLWLVLGVVIGMSDPLGDTRAGRGSPLVGWIVAAAAVWMVVELLREARTPAPQSRGGGRYARDPRPCSGREKARLLGAGVLSLLLGAWLIWLGCTEDNTAAIAFGVFAWSMVVGLVATVYVAYRQS